MCLWVGEGEGREGGSWGKEGGLWIFPNEPKEYVKIFLSSTPTVRPDADQLSEVKIKIFVWYGCVWVGMLDGGKRKGESYE